MKEKNNTRARENKKIQQNKLFNLSFLAVCELTHQSKSKRKTQTRRKPNKKSIRQDQSKWNCLRFADVFLLFEYKFQFVFQITGKCAHFCRQVYFLVVFFGRSKFCVNQPIDFIFFSIWISINLIFLFVFHSIFLIFLKMFESH